jgi:ParB family chromosome partitioning protein
MAKKKRGLGRGLDALLGTIGADPAVVQPSASVSPIDKLTEPVAGLAADSVDNPTGNSALVALADPPPAVIDAGDRLAQLPVERLRPGKYQPRMAMRAEALDELAESIRSQGVLQPIVVRPLVEADGGETEYEIIAGERRWRASQLAGLDTIPALIREVSDSAALAISLIENIQREDLNPIEEACALQKLIDEFDMTHQEVGVALGRSRAGISNLLSLLTLTPEVRSLLENGDLEMGHARALLGLDQVTQVDAGRTVANRGLSVRETEELVRRILNPPVVTNPVVGDPNIRNLQEDLAGRLGAKVLLQHSSRGKGKLIVHYNSLDELDGILAHIK